VSQAQSEETKRLTEVRDLLGQSFEAFNDALAALGSPYRPITHPDLHAQVFGDFVSSHEQQIVDALRERYKPLALAGDDLSGYVAGRRLESLEPDPAWLHRFKIPPEDEIRRVVATWLRSHGVCEQLDEPAAVADVGELRRTNFARVEDIVDKARLRVVAWCRLNRQPVPPGWPSVAAITVRGAIEGEGIADLIELEDTWVLERSAQVLGWPAAMARTLVLDELDMSTEDLSIPSDESAEGVKPQKRTPTIDVAGRSVLDVVQRTTNRVAGSSSRQLCGIQSLRFCLAVGRMGLEPAAKGFMIP